ncbi:MAG TPA: IS1182 family transposase [Candidatus Dormibacteraeota bacterium]
MMGTKTVEPKLYLSFSLDGAVPRDHILRRLAAAVDFSFVAGLVRKFYSHTGQPSVDPVVIFKLSLLGYLFNIKSERRICEEASLNLAWRWFLGYELDEPIPDHSVLSKARKRYGVAVYERFFQQVVRLCEAKGLVQGDVLFLDATMTEANASIQSMRSRKLLEQRLPAAKQFVADLWLVNDAEPEPAPRPKKPRSGRPVNPDAKYLQSRSVTNELRVSSSDPDAQIFHKLGETPMLAHKTQVVVDGGAVGIITAVDVRPACEADSHAVGRMLDKHYTAVGRPARELVGDTGYGREAAFKACLARGVQPTLLVRDLGNRHGGFNRDRFTYLAERDVFICPEGKELRHFTDNFQQRQAIYKPRRGTCKSCQLKAQCSPGQGDRAVIRRWDVDLWHEVEQHLASRHGRAMLRRRRIVSERIFADAKVKHGLDRAQFRGRAKVQIQALLTAATMNVKQLLRRRPVPQAGIAIGLAGQMRGSVLASALFHFARPIERLFGLGPAFDHVQTLPLIP